MRISPYFRETPRTTDLLPFHFGSLSGKLATGLCSADEANPPVSDLIAREDVPRESCDWHTSATICVDSGAIASPYCPESSLKQSSGVIIPSDSAYGKLSQEELLKIVPNAIINNKEDAGICTVHDENWKNNNDKLQSAIESANSTIKYANSALSFYGEK